MRGWKQQSCGARELQTRGQEAPASGVAPALEVGFRVADIEQIDEPRGGEGQSRDDVHNEGNVHRAAPRCVGMAPICWNISRRLRMTDLRGYNAIHNRIVSMI